jgi:hypothetical protein
MKTKPASFEQCLAAASDDKRPALEKLRKAIRAAAPAAEECVSYGLAAFRLDGRPPVPHAAKTCPASCTTCIINQQNAISEAMKTARWAV